MIRTISRCSILTLIITLLVYSLLYFTDYYQLSPFFRFLFNNKTNLTMPKVSRRCHRPSLSPTLYLRRTDLQHLSRQDLLNLMEDEIDMGKQGTITGRMNETFRDELAPLGQRVRNQAPTTIAKARVVWLYYRRYCRFEKASIKLPAMRLWVEDHLGKGSRAHVFTADVRRRIMDPSLETDMTKIA